MNEELSKIKKTLSNLQESLSKILVDYERYPDDRAYQGSRLILAHHSTISMILRAMSIVLAELEPTKEPNVAVQQPLPISVAQLPKEKEITNPNDRVLTTGDFLNYYPICSCSYLLRKLKSDIGLKNFCVHSITDRTTYLYEERTLTYFSKEQGNGSVKRFAVECLKKLQEKKNDSKSGSFSS